MRRALLLPFAALLLAAASEPECPVTSRYCVKLGDSWSNEAVVTIVRRDGTVVRKLAGTDIFTAHDAQSFSMFWFGLQASYRGETLILAVPTRVNDPTAPTEEIRIDLARGIVTRPEYDIFPAPRVWMTASDPQTPPSRAQAPCITSRTLRISSDELLARATDHPLPEYPLVALRARFEDVARIELVIASDGTVLCTRITKPAPFGLDVAAEKAVGDWKFQPAAGTVVGDVEFHFKRVPWDVWP